MYKCIHLNVLTCIGWVYKVHAIQSRCTVFIYWCLLKYLYSLLYSGNEVVAAVKLITQYYVLYSNKVFSHSAYRTQM